MHNRRSSNGGQGGKGTQRAVGKEEKKGREKYEVSRLPDPSITTRGRLSRSEEEGKKERRGHVFTPFSGGGEEGRDKEVALRP